MSADLHAHADAMASQGLPAALDRPAVYVAACRRAYELAYIYDIDPGRAPANGLEHLERLDDREARDLCEAMSSACLDLGQHLAFSLEALREDLRPQAGRRAVMMFRQIADLPVADLRAPDEISPGIAVFGERGLERFSG